MAISPIGNTLVMVNGSTMLASCDPNCFTCVATNPGSCLVCIPGYYLGMQTTANANNGYCIPCNPTCMYCVSAQPNNCTGCYAGAFLATGTNTCTTCTFPCITCTLGSADTCTSCPSGYTLSNFICTVLSPSSNSSCGQNCATCIQKMSQTSAMCTNCLPGYVLTTASLCVPCVSNCSVCTLNTNTQTNNQPSCSACSIGYFLNPQSLMCLQCGTYCASCFNSTICFTCLPGFSFTSTYQCVMRCAYPCATCSTTNPSACTSCQAGFNLNSGSNSCSTTCMANSTSCNICPFGFSLNVMNSSQTCVMCTAASSCARCDSTDPSICISCVFGSYLGNASTCLLCSTGCNNCLNLNTCFSCMMGYVAILPATLVTGGSITQVLTNAAQSNNIVYQPVMCAACMSPCMTCINNPSSCISCVAGFSLRGTVCISSFYYGVKVTFDVNPSTFLNNYYGYLMQLSSSVNQNIGSIIINSITYGSAAVDSSVTTTAAQGSTTATTQQSNLTNFVQKTTVAGMSVLTSSVTTATTSGGDTTVVVVEDNTTTIILAVVIPVCVVRTY